MHNFDHPSDSDLLEASSCYEYYFDTQGFSRMSNVIDEAALARLLTKLAVGTATVWWSLLEIKEMVSLYRRTRKNHSS